VIRYKYTKRARDDFHLKRPLSEQFAICLHPALLAIQWFNADMLASNGFDLWVPQKLTGEDFSEIADYIHFAELASKGKVK
jgi:hypothetical protein